MTHEIWTSNEVDGLAKDHDGTQVQVAYDLRGESLMFHGTLSRVENTWVLSRRANTINLQATDVDVYDFTAYVRGNSAEGTSRDDVEASKKATRTEKGRGTRAKKTVAAMQEPAPRPATQLTALHDHRNGLKDDRARRDEDRTRKTEERHPLHDQRSMPQSQRVVLGVRASPSGAA
jgi:hypothetical protein